MNDTPAETPAKPVKSDETCGRVVLKKCPHCPGSSHKRFKGVRGLKLHHNAIHKDIDFSDPGDQFENIVEIGSVPLDFSLDGAQSLSLQSYLLSKGNVPPNNERVTPDFNCTPCKRSFNSFDELQDHLSLHDKLFDKIRVKQFDRKHKGFDQEFFLPVQEDSYDCSPTNLEEFLRMNGVDLRSASSEPLNVHSLSQPMTKTVANNICSVCRFVAKSKGGLKLHMKIHIGSEKRDNAMFNEQIDGELIDAIAFYRRNTRLLHQIPKGARTAAADKLSKLIDMCILKNDLASWRCLFLFSYTTLFVPEKDIKTSLTSAVKKNILTNQHSQPKNLLTPHPRTCSKDGLAHRIENKVADGDIKNAMRLLTSEDSLAPETEETFLSLLSKHPKPSRVICLPEPPNDIAPIVVDERTVLKAVNNYKKGSAAGLDGLKPQFLKDMLSKHCGEAAKRLLKSITNLMNFMLSGKLCTEICDLMFGAVLIALKKKDGGIRPIAIGNTFRRLCAKLGCNAVSVRIANYLYPKQVGFSVRGGCEAAVHAARKFIATISCPRKVLLKKDLKNAFNSLERDTILNSVKDKAPELFPLMWQAYA